MFRVDEFNMSFEFFIRLEAFLGIHAGNFTPPISTNLHSINDPPYPIIFNWYILMYDVTLRNKWEYGFLLDPHRHINFFIW